MSPNFIFGDIKNRSHELLKIGIWDLLRLGSLVLLEVLVFWVFTENNIRGHSHRGKEGISYSFLVSRAGQRFFKSPFPFLVLSLVGSREIAWDLEVQWSSSLVYQLKVRAGFSSVAQSCLTLCDPCTAAHQASLSITISQSLLKLMSIESVMPSNHLILYRPFSSCLHSFPASGSFPVSQFFASGGQSIGVSASASALPMNIQDWSPLGGLVWSPCNPRNSQESSPKLQFKSIHSLAFSFLYSQTLISIHDYWKNHSFD